MSSAPVSLMYGSQAFPTSSARAVCNMIDVAASSAKQRMVARSAVKALNREVEITSLPSTYRVGGQDKAMIGRSDKILAEANGTTDKFGFWNYEVGGLPNGTILSFTVYSNNTVTNTALLVAEGAPEIRLLTDFPYEPMQVSSCLQLFAGNAWPLSLSDIGEYVPFLGANYVMDYSDLFVWHSTGEFPESAILYLEFEDGADLVPDVDIAVVSEEAAPVVVPRGRRNKRQIRVPRKGR